MRVRHSPVKSILLSVGLLLLPLTAMAAVPVSDVLRMVDSAPVSRGEFIRAVVKVLGVTGGGNAVLPYRRVPRDLEQQVKAAYAAGALATFGDELYAGQPITRGQALEVVTTLQHLTAKAATQYRDARSSDRLAIAVQVAVDRSWMTPRSSVLFGVAEVLTGKEARLLLRKVLGEGGEQNDQTDSVPTVEIRFTTPGSTQTAGFNAGTSALPKAQILEALWKIIEDDYVHEDKINADEAAYKAAEAMVDSLGDPYSTFYRPAGSRAFQSRIQGEVSGIGAQVEDREGVLTITTPLSNSPAERAGLKPNDQIIAVDGQSLSGLSYEEMVDHVRGPKGSVAKLRIRRNGAEFDVEVTRDTIKVPEIEIKWQEEIAVVKLMQFGKLSETDLRPQMLHIQEQNPKGIILDLRNNPGGLLHAATVVASNFLPKGSGVAIIRSRSGERTEMTEDAPTVDPSVPLVVLVNGGSASASEIVTAALQDADRATIVGEQTFGKGTVQEVLEFSDKSSLKLTIAEWLSPLGHKIDGVGVKPDSVVPTGERDEQMTKAIAILKANRR
ncbi:MAG: S41 family peptidase [Candidatus Peribacteraceae bacterium]|nr:S41 family peptidase [Candidatus Peribacteraceae bacterium]MDD5742988.1 S41 family peptidase [Candidatus Peribacteraceae bacterium]